MMPFQSPPIPLEQTPEGVIRVKGTRVTLDAIIYAFKQGATAETIAEMFPAVSLVDVYGVIHYYLAEIVAVDAYLKSSRRAQDELDARIDAEYPQVGIRARLLARKNDR